MDPPTSAELRKESSLALSSKPLPTFDQGNSSTRTSSLVGNFFVGFALVSLLLAIWLAPPALRSKLVAGVLVALGAANTVPIADTVSDSDFRFTSHDLKATGA